MIGRSFPVRDRESTQKRPDRDNGDRSPAGDRVRRAFPKPPFSGCGKVPKLETDAISGPWVPPRPGPSPEPRLSTARKNDRMDHLAIAGRLTDDFWVLVWARESRLTDELEKNPAEVLAAAEVEDGDLPPAPSDALLGLTSGPERTPPRTPDELICLRGPCKYYWHFVSLGDWGNPSNTWTEQMPAPRPHHHVCLRSVGLEDELDFSDNHIFACNQWSPLSGLELATMLARREAYYAEHPEHRPEPPPLPKEQDE